MSTFEERKKNFGSPSIPLSQNIVSIVFVHTYILVLDSAFVNHSRYRFQRKGGIFHNKPIRTWTKGQGVTSLVLTDGLFWTQVGVADTKKRNVGPEVCAWCEGCVSPCRLGSFCSQQVDITRVYLKTVFFVPIELLFSTGHARWTSHICFKIFCALNLFPINGYYFPYNSFCGCRPSRTLLWLDKQVHIKRWRHQQEACDVTN